ncbi:hypothetical protein JHD48_00135 [Sulfurimonas sp. SAG-AH-194-I05]|nr:hypothetical protein [Sulfurimonas sp. SAG-AH-194-I05]MDF1874133.1 hypothetical protein [Sulfurimonas sp. SAG-AH-194-I05]
MRDLIYEVMTDYANIVIFIHVMSAVIWVGGMVALFVITRSAHPRVSVEKRLAGRASLIKKYFKFLAFFITTSALSALFMALGYKDNAIDTQGFILDANSMEIYRHITMKISIWIAMVMNMLLMTWIITKAQSEGCSATKATDCMWTVNSFLLPVNIIMGTVAIYIGITINAY